MTGRMSMGFKTIPRGLAGLAMAIVMLAAGEAAAKDLLGAPAPEFTLRGLAGSNLSLREQRGRVVMINFWATWCGPCRQEMPLLDQMYRRYRDMGFVLMGINVEDDARKAGDMARALGVRYPVLFDTKKAASKAYGVSAMPTTVLLDRDGRVRYLHKGYRPGYERTYHAQIRELLKE
jgi:thiol-disulfide isomerase/thioredoxin